MISLNQSFGRVDLPIINDEKAGEKWLLVFEEKDSNQALNGTNVIYALLSTDFIIASAIFSTGYFFLSSRSAFISEFFLKLDPVKESGIIIETLMSYSSCYKDWKKLCTADFDAQ